MAGEWAARQTDPRKALARGLAGGKLLPRFVAAAGRFQQPLPMGPRPRRWRF
jgi:hypothetical protein